MDDGFPYVLALDSGGTKTVVLLVAADGEVVACRRGPGVANASDDAQVVARLLEPLFGSILAALPSGASVGAAYGCLGGLNVDAVEAGVRQLLGIDNVLVRRESSGEVVFTCAPYWGFDIAVMAGTGSIALGINADGDRRVVGGWGALIHDRGSGHAVGRQALQVVAETLDFRGDRTALLPALGRTDPFARVMPAGIDLTCPPRDMSYGTRLAIKETIKRALPELDRPTIAGMFRVVAECADQGDAAAAAILDQAGCDLAALVCALADELALSAPTVFAMGGVFGGGSCIFAPFRDAIHARFPRANVAQSDFALVTGAGIVALRRAGLAVDDDVVQRLRASAARHVAG